MAKIKVEEIFTSGDVNDITILDDRGRIWIWAVDKWVLAMEIPDEPNPDNTLDKIEA